MSFARRIVNAASSIRLIGGYRGRGFISSSQIEDVLSGTYSTSARNNAALRAAVSLISNPIAAMPMHVIKLDDDNPRIEGSIVSGHRLNAFLRAPFSYISRQVGFTSLLEDMLVTGNGYAYVARNGDGTPARIVLAKLVELIPLNSNNITDPARYKLKLATHSGKNHKEVVADRADVIALHGDGYDKFTAKSPSPIAASISAALQISDDAYNLQKGYLKSGPHILAILKTQQAMGAEDKRNQDKALRKKQGARNASALTSLPHDVTFEKTDFSPFDLAALEYMRWSVNEIARIYNIPPGMLGEATSGTQIGSGLAEHNARFVSFTLRRHVERLEQQLTRTLLTATARRWHGKATFGSRAAGAQ